VTVTKIDLARELEYHLAKGHERGCPIRSRHAVCDCRYDEETNRLIHEAVKEIKTLTDRIGELEHELERRGY